MYQVCQAAASQGTTLKVRFFPRSVDPTKARAPFCNHGKEMTVQGGYYVCTEQASDSKCVYRFHQNMWASLFMKKQNPSKEWEIILCNCHEIYGAQWFNKSNPYLTINIVTNPHGLQVFGTGERIPFLALTWQCQFKFMNAQSDKKVGQCEFKTKNLASIGNNASLFYSDWKEMLFDSKNKQWEGLITTLLNKGAITYAKNEAVILTPSLKWWAMAEALLTVYGDDEAVSKRIREAAGAATTESEESDEGQWCPHSWKTE
jgi:hypothetical protein